jgi:hypothetical protein
MTELERQFLTPAPGVVARAIDDQLVLVHLNTHQIYSLNQTGARLWELAERGLSREDAQNVIVSEYAVSATQISAEVEELVAALSAAKLIERPG